VVRHREVTVGGGAHGIPVENSAVRSPSDRKPVNELRWSMGASARLRCGETPGDSGFYSCGPGPGSLRWLTHRINAIDPSTSVLRERSAPQRLLHALLPECNQLRWPTHTAERGHGQTRPRSDGSLGGHDDQWQPRRDQYKRLGRRSTRPAWMYSRLCSRTNECHASGNKCSRIRSCLRVGGADPETGNDATSNQSDHDLLRLYERFNPFRHARRASSVRQWRTPSSSRRAILCRPLRFFAASSTHRCPGHTDGLEGWYPYPLIAGSPPSVGG
jgi:hypothetical protein